MLYFKTPHSGVKCLAACIDVQLYVYCFIRCKQMHLWSSKQLYICPNSSRWQCNCCDVSILVDVARLPRAKPYLHSPVRRRLYVCQYTVRLLIHSSAQLMFKIRTMNKITHIYEYVQEFFIVFRMRKYFTHSPALLTCIRKARENHEVTIKNVMDGDETFL